jgi:hypothetical protein
VNRLPFLQTSIIKRLHKDWNDSRSSSSVVIRTPPPTSSAEQDGRTGSAEPHSAGAALEVHDPTSALADLALEEAEERPVAFARGVSSASSSCRSPIYATA